MSQCFLLYDDDNVGCVFQSVETHYEKLRDPSFLLEKLWIREHWSNSAAFQSVNRAYLFLLYIMYILLVLFYYIWTLLNKTCLINFIVFYKVHLVKIFLKRQGHNVWRKEIFWHFKATQSCCIGQSLDGISTSFAKISLFYSGETPEATVLMIVLLYSFIMFFLRIIFYNILYFCTVCSVMHFLLVCHSNVAADVENWTALQLVMHSSKASLFYTLSPLL